MAATTNKASMNKDKTNFGKVRSFAQRTDTITLNDHPGAFETFEGVEKLGVAIDPTPYESNNGIITEVGKAGGVRAGGNLLLAYPLRRAMKDRLPSHLFGKLHLSDAFSQWKSQSTALPAVGTTVIVKPTLSMYQETISRMYTAGRFDSVYILTVLEPFGGSHFIEVTAIDMNTKNVLKGVKWRPTIMPHLVVVVPFRADKKVSLPGTSYATASNAIKLTMHNDNTSTNVSLPVYVSIHSCSTNLSAVGLKSTFDDKVWWENIVEPRENTPKPPTPRDVVVRLQMADVDPVAGADATEQDPAVGVDDETSTVVATQPAETIAPKPTASGSNKKGTKGNQTGAQAAKWVKLRTLTFTDAELGKRTFITFDPALLEKRGENLMKPYKRNVWFTTPQSQGYTKGFSFKVVSNRSPAFTGMIDIIDVAGNGHVRTHVIGGATTEFEMVPRAHELASINAKTVNSPWLSCTKQREVGCYFTLTQLNRTDERASAVVELYVRPGGNIFQVPVKPRKPTKTVSGSITNESSSDNLIRIGAALKGVVREQSTFVDDDPGHFTVPGAEAPEIGEFEHVTEDEMLDQDSQWVSIGTIMCKPGEVTTVPLNMYKVVDKYGAGGPSPMAEKFERFTTLEPRSTGDFGPAIGDYQLVVRVPTGVACNVAHVAIPADMNDEVASYIFGLSSILSLAGSAIGSIGGPLLSGAISTLTNLVGGGSGDPVGTETPREQSPGNLTGKIPVSRFVDLIRLVTGSAGAESANNDNLFGSLLVQILDLMTDGTRAVDAIPVNVLVRMDAGAMTECFERVDVQPEPVLTNSLFLQPIDQVEIFTRLAQEGREEDAIRMLMRFDTEKAIDVMGLLEDELPTKAAYESRLQIMRAQNLF